MTVDGWILRPLPEFTKPCVSAAAGTRDIEAEAEASPMLGKRLRHSVLVAVTVL